MGLYYLFIRGMFPCLILLSACENPQENDAREIMQEFEIWFSEQTRKSGTWQPQEWKQVKDYYLDFESEMETRSGALSEESNQRYHSLKRRFKKWEEEINQERASLSDSIQIAWLNKLLGPYANTAAITPDNVREAYVMFMDNVRQQYREWDSKDWERTARVHSLLAERKNQLEQNIPVTSEIKIKALQAEFETLQAGEEVKDAVN